MENTMQLSPLEQFQKEVEKRQAELNDLRLDGVTKIENLKNEITNVKKNKQLDAETKGKLVEQSKKELLEAKQVRDERKEDVKAKVNELIAYIKTTTDGFINTKKEDNKTKIAELKAKFNEDLARENERYKKALEELNANKDENYSNKLKDLRVEHRQLYLMRFNAIEAANNKRLPIVDDVHQKAENYLYGFSWRKFLLNNGLYLAIIAMLIVAIIMYAAQRGGFLLSWTTIVLILNQTAPKVFLALGVAGLIVLAGTDLSIGRLVGLSAVLTGMMVTTTGETSVEFFGVSPSFVGMPLGLRVVFGFLLSIVACVVITSIAGFFSAKFKMHPFISTLATQLFTFGMLAGITGNSFTGSPDSGVVQAVSGVMGSSGISVMVIYAIIGIAAVWFIWNKTTFGKNMFAVGGNPEAATVSGISVFWVTMFVFILAGVLYGIGGSIYGIYTGNVRAQTGQGMETDAIAACVVGGVSFTGGVGKVRGVVIGALLFQMITVILPYLGITDTNYQLAIKGVIVLAAVALDCAKYLKKK